MTTDQAIQVLDYMDKMYQEQMVTNTWLALMAGIMFAVILLSFVYMRTK